MQYNAAPAINAKLPPMKLPQSVSNLYQVRSAGHPMHTAKLLQQNGRNLHLVPCATMRLGESRIRRGFTDGDTRPLFRCDVAYPTSVFSAAGNQPSLEEGAAANSRLG